MGGIFLSGNCPGGSCPTWELSRGDCPWWQLSRGNCPRWQLSSGELSSSLMQQGVKFTEF